VKRDGFQVSPWPHLRNAVIQAANNERPHAIYAAGAIDGTAALERIAELRRATRVALSLHAYVLGCVARAAAEHRMLHAFRHGKKLITFDALDVGTIIDQHASDKLRTRLPVVYVVRDAARKSIAQINWEIRCAARTDLGKNPDVAYRRRLTTLPAPVQKIMFRRLLRDPWLHRRFFGTLGFTSTQSPGFDRPVHAFVTNIHTATIAMGNVHSQFLPDENGQPVLRRMLDMAGSFDHDMVDGMLLSRFGLAVAQRIESCDGLGDDFIRETRELAAHDKAKGNA
jgi:pyruvate/2-oxoglutarate dehydrogenase complex dihydrolipoamide acyltransferase (E2) component